MAEDRRYFQFIVGPRRGEVLFFDSIESEDGLIYIKFKDNSRMGEEFIAQINQREVTGKLMAEIDSPMNCWQFREKPDEDNKPRLEKDAQTGEVFEIPSVDDYTHADGTGETIMVNPKKKKKAIDLIPPKPTPSSHSVFGAIRAATVTSAPTIDNTVINIKTQQTQPNAVQQAANMNDPVVITLEKSKKVESQIELILTVMVPSKELFNLIKENFENGEEKTLNYIIENIDVNKIKESLLLSFKNFYNLKNSLENKIISESGEEI